MTEEELELSGDCRGGRKGLPPDPALNLTAPPASLSPRTGDPGYLAGTIVDNAIKGS